ncbi:MAG TPA: hypothetical protein DCO77_03980, partial [Nitrospiraceae bacterium]|nr:hypothetical protein [Nitrospiraceae bacterium]
MRERNGHRETATAAHSAIAKITRPRLPRVFRRERLFSLLDHDRELPVTWVSGPAGSGKTTLVCDYLDARNLPCLWYQMDERDEDIATFFYYMGLAAKKAAPRIKRPLPLLTPEYRAGIPTFTQRYFENLCSRLKPPYLIVFDNYQEVPSHSPFHELIRTGLSVLPENISAIVISRSEPPLAFTGMLAGNKIAPVGWDELRLTAEESRGIASLHLEGSRNWEAISWMHDKVHGWAAGLILLSKFIKRHAVDPQALTALAPEQVFDYFANELFDRDEEGIRDFLLKTSFLPRITPLVAERLTANKAAAKILADLNRRNYFTEKRLDRELSYQYHPIFREFLISRANKVFSAAALTGLHLTGARLLEEAGQIEDAAALFVKAESWADLVKLILSHARTLITQGRDRTLEEWIDCIPPGLISHNGWLLYWKGICRFVYGQLESRQYFERAFDLFRTQSDAAGIFLSWSGVIETTLLGKREYISADRWISILDDLLREGYRFPSREIEARVVGSMLFALTLRQPHHRDMKQWLERALKIARQTVDREIKSFLDAYLEMYYLSVGDHAGAEAIMKSIERRMSFPDASPLARIAGRMMAAVYYVRMADHQRCMQVVREGLELGENTGIRQWDSHLYSMAVSGYMGAGDYEHAEEYLRKMGAVMNDACCLDACMYYEIAAWFSLMQRDIARATVYAEKALLFALEAGMPMYIGICHCAIAQVLHEQGEHKKAASHLTRSLDVCKAMGSRIIEFMALLCRAYFSLARGEESASLISLRKAMALGRDQGYLNTFWWRPEVMSQLCAKALDAGIEVAYVRHLIRKRGLNPPDAIAECGEPSIRSRAGSTAELNSKSAIRNLKLDNWPWPFRIYTLGRFAMERDGGPFRFEGREPRKLLALLKLLITAGEKGLNEYQTSDALWPHADGDAARSAFTTTLQRLRKLVGENIIRYKAGIVSLDPRFCWVDAWAFERMLASAELEMRNAELKSEGKQSSVSNQQSTILQRLEKALHLYHGDFLGEEAVAPWAFPYREHLRIRLHKCVRKLGAFHESEGNWKASLELYEHGLAVDDLSEEFTQQYLICCKELGLRSEG